MTTRVRVAVAALVAGGYAGAGAQAADGLIARESWGWVEMLARGALYALMAALITWLRRSGLGLSQDQREGAAEVRAALASGALPVGARPGAWRRAVAHEVSELRRSRWIGGVLAMLIAALVAVAAVVANDNARPVWALAIVLAAFAVVPVRWLTRRADRAEALLARLNTP